jgi:hypothetical protein
LHFSGKLGMRASIVADFGPSKLKFGEILVKALKFAET